MLCLWTMQVILELGTQFNPLIVFFFYLYIDQVQSFLLTSKTCLMDGGEYDSRERCSLWNRCYTHADALDQNRPNRAFYRMSIDACSLNRPSRAFYVSCRYMSVCLTAQNAFLVMSIHACLLNPQIVHFCVTSIHACLFSRYQLIVILNALHSQCTLLPFCRASQFISGRTALKLSAVLSLLFGPKWALI